MCWTLFVIFAKVYNSETGSYACYNFQGFHGNDNMVTTAYHVQFSLPLSLITVQWPEEYE